MELSLLVLATAVAAAIGRTALRARRERLAIDITRPLPARPAAGGREYRHRGHR